VTTESPEKSAATRVKDTVEAIAKIFLGIVAILYITGFTVVTIYLNKFGVSSVEFFKTSYIAAGLWAVMPLIVPLAIVVILICSLMLTSSRVKNTFVKYISLPLTEESYDRRTDLIFVILVLALGIGFVYITVAGIGIPWYREWFWDFVMGTLAITLLLVTLGMLTRSQTKGILYLARGTLAGFLGCVIIILEVFSFAYDTFGTIPAYIGGGAPAKVELCLELDRETRLFLQTIGIAFSESTGCSTQDVFLLFASEKEYVISVVDRTEIRPKAIAIRRELVKTTIFREAAPVKIY
jgi:hypothetical protein